MDATGAASPSAVLEEQLCFALYSASRAVTGAYAEVFERYGLTYPQYLVLLVLWESDGRTVGELASRLHLTSATLSPLLTRLEAAGRVRRERSRTDARTVRVLLTEQGRDLRSILTEAQACLTTDARLTVDEAIMLRDLARRLTTTPTHRSHQESR